MRRTGLEPTLAPSSCAQRRRSDGGTFEPSASRTTARSRVSAREDRLPVVATRYPGPASERRPRVRRGAMEVERAGVLPARIPDNRSRSPGDIARSTRRPPRSRSRIVHFAASPTAIGTKLSCRAPACLMVSIVRGSNPRASSRRAPSKSGCLVAVTITSPSMATSKVSR